MTTTHPASCGIRCSIGCSRQADGRDPKRLGLTQQLCGEPARFLDLRHQMEDLDLAPHQGHSSSSAPQTARDLPVRHTRSRVLLTTSKEHRFSPHHIDAIITTLYQGQDSAPARQRVHQAGESQPLGWQRAGCPNYSDLAQRLDAALTAKIASPQGDRTRPGARPEGRLVVPRSTVERGPAHPARGQRPGLSRARHHPPQQPEARPGLTTGNDHDHRRPAHRRDRRPGTRGSEARPRSDRGPQHDRLQPYRVSRQMLHQSR